MYFDLEESGRGIRTQTLPYDRGKGAIIVLRLPSTLRKRRGKSDPGNFMGYPKGHLQMIGRCGMDTSYY